MAGGEEYTRWMRRKKARYPDLSHCRASPWLWVGTEENLEHGGDADHAVVQPQFVHHLLQPFSHLVSGSFSFSRMFSFSRTSSVAKPEARETGLPLKVPAW